MSVQLESCDDLMSILEDESLIDRPLSGSPQAGGNGSGLASSDSAAEGRGSGSDTSPTPDPSDLSWPEYLQKVKETFIRARPLIEVEAFASTMGFKDWMDYVVKLMPKDVKIQGEVNFRHMIAELGPIDKEQFRLVEPVVEAEFCEAVDVPTVES